MTGTAARAVVLAAAVVALALVPLLGGKFAVDFVTKMMVSAIFALSLELLVGQTGLVCFGQAAFFGVAAYACVLLTPKGGPASVWWLAPASLGAAALYALVMGSLSIRTRGVYFIMVTLAFSQLVYFVFHDTKLGGGSDGIYLYAKPHAKLGSWMLFDLANSTSFYYVLLVLLVLVFAFLRLLLASRFGRALAGIRSNEQRMRALGFNIFAYKLAAFVLAGAIAGLAGYFAAVQFGFVNPEMLSWHQSANVLLMVILGGSGTPFGAIVGAFSFIVLEDLFSLATKHWLLFMGGFVILAVMLLPRGLVSVGERRRTRVTVESHG